MKRLPLACGFAAVGTKATGVLAGARKNARGLVAYSFDGDEGVLETVKTIGGHRRYRLDALHDFA